MVAAQTPSNDVMDLGFLCAAFAWSIWWNLDWQRFAKFYVRDGPPYRRGVKIGLRIFFALCLAGTGIGLVEQLTRQTRSLSFYAKAWGVAAVWLLVIILVVKTVERLMKKDKTKASDTGRPAH